MSDAADGVVVAYPGSDDRLAAAEVSDDLALIERQAGLSIGPTIAIKRNTR